MDMMEVDPMKGSKEKQDGLGRISSGSSAETGCHRYHKKDIVREKGKMQKVVNHEHSHYTESHTSRKKEHVSDNKDHEHKADVAKSAVSVCGDWSEHISSSGKRYYYNCKTEVSQWSKPKDWVDSKSDTRSRESDRHYEGQKRSNHGNHGYDSKHRHLENDERSDGYHGSNTRTKEHRRLHGSPHKNSNGGDAMRKENHSDNKWNKRGNNLDTYYHRTKKEHFSNHYHTEQSNCDRSVNKKLGHLPSNAASSSLHPAGPRDDHTTVPSRSQNQSEDSRHTEDMDISPGNSPNSSPRRTSSQITTSHTSSHQDVSSSSNMVTSSIIQQLRDKRLNSSDSQNLTQQAIETLKKLQEAITSTLKSDQKREQPQATNQQSPRCTEVVTSVTSPAQSQQPPEIVLQSNIPAAKQQAESPRTEVNIQISSQNVSPAHSQGSSQGDDASPNCVLTTGIKPPPVHMTPTLTNYYNNDLTVHLSGWPADGIEGQANQCGEEGTTVGNLHCTQVSADLKTARSLVRVAEIQSTLYEQRILLIKQEIKDLGNLRTQNAFLSAEDV